MSLLSYDRHCGEIVTQTDLLSSYVKEVDPTRAVPSCPGWTVGRLVRHLGDVQRWAEATVRSRAERPLPVEHSRGLPSAACDDPAILGPWLAEGAAGLAQTLRAAGPGMPVWTPVPGGTTDFYARRFTHETAIHRADATLAGGAEYALDDDVALDAASSASSHSWCTPPGSPRGRPPSIRPSRRWPVTTRCCWRPWPRGG